MSLHQAEEKRDRDPFQGENDSIIFNTSSHEPIRRGVEESDQLEVEHRLTVTMRVTCHHPPGEVLHR